MSHITCHFFILEKVLKLVGGVFVNNEAYPVSVPIMSYVVQSTQCRQAKSALTISWIHMYELDSRIQDTGHSWIPGHQDEETRTSGLGYHNTRLGYQNTNCGYHYAITARPRCHRQYYSHTVQRLSQTSPIKLIFGEFRDKCANFIWL